MARVIGFDESPEMLAKARETLEGLENVVLVAAKGDALPLSEGALDAAFANMYLHHVADPPAAIAEMARVLKPGGFLVVIDADEHDQV